MGSYRRVLLVASLLVALVLAVLVLRPPRKLRWWLRQRPNVLVVLIDTLRADRVLPDANGKSTMPFLADYAAHALSYERAYAPSAWTLPSLASVFTAQYPREHGVGHQWFSSAIPASANTLGSVLLQHGYATYAISAHSGVGPQTCGRGFQHFDVVDLGIGKTDAHYVNDAVATWLGALPDPSPPWLLYLHYMDMHSDYRKHPGLTVPRDATLERTDVELAGPGTAALADSEAKRRAIWNFTPAEVRRMRQLYDGEARYVDQRLRELFAELERGGALANTIVVITGDHGEELGEHDIFGHGTSLYETLVRVPLIIKIPGVAPAVIGEPVSIAGLAPALLEELDLPAPKSFHVPPLPLAADDDGALVYAELPANSRLKLRLHQSAVIGSDAKLLLTPSGESVFYDLRADPAERVTRKSVPHADELLAAEARLHTGEHATTTPTIKLDAAMIERLRRLGYEE